MAIRRTITARGPAAAATGAAGNTERDIKLVMSNLDKILDNIGVAAEIAAREIADEVLKATKPFVPVDTSALVNSGRVEVKPGKDGVQASVIFGGPGIDYAVIVHEDMTKNHEAPTSAKFLNLGYAEAASRIDGIITKHMKKV